MNNKFSAAQSALLVFGLVSLTVFSCRKDEGACAGLNPSGYPEELTIGDESAVKLWKPDFALQGKYHDDSSYYCDIDQDHISDFEINHGVSDGGGGGGQSYNWIFVRTSLAETYFAYAEGDLVYKDTDTLYEGTNPVHVTIITYSSCTDPGTADAVMTVEDDIRLVAPGDVVHLNDNWQNAELTFLRGPLGDAMYYETGSWNSTSYDTLGTFINSRSTLCEELSDNNTVYIPFKKITCGIERMGWIKMEVVEDASAVIIREIAVQF